jgi:hypothetical protein
MDTPATIAGHRVLEPLGGSKRFDAFRVDLPVAAGGALASAAAEARATLYLMAEPVTHSDMFVEVANAVRAAWPFQITTARDYILPQAQLWQNRPWFVVPDSLPVAGSLSELAPNARAALRKQLSWLSEFTHPWVDDIEFGHGDLRAPRVALLGGAEPVMIAPGWVAASDLARGRGLVDARVDDAWHLARLLASKAAAARATNGVHPRPGVAARPAAKSSPVQPPPVQAAPVQPPPVQPAPVAARPPARAPVAPPPVAPFVAPEPVTPIPRVSETISSEPAPLLTFDASSSGSVPPPSDPAFAQPEPYEAEELEAEELEAEVIPSQPAELQLSTSRTAPTFPINSMPPGAPSMPPGPGNTGAARMPGAPPPYVPPQPPVIVPESVATNLPSMPQPAPFAPNIPPLTVGQQPAGSGSTKWIILAVLVIGAVLAALALLR